MNLPHELIDILEFLYPTHVFKLERTRTNIMYPSLGMMIKLSVILDGTERSISTVYDNGYIKQLSLSPHRYRICENSEEAKQYLHETIDHYNKEMASHSSKFKPIERKQMAE